MSQESIKTATILISTGDGTEVYRSVEELPHELRRKLADATNRPESATILIADQRGREEIAKAVGRQQGPFRFRFLESLQLELEKTLAPPLRFAYLRWLRLILLLGAGVICWLAWRAGR